MYEVLITVSMLLVSRADCKRGPSAMNHIPGDGGNRMTSPSPSQLKDQGLSPH